MGPYLNTQYESQPTSLLKVHTNDMRSAIQTLKPLGRVSMGQVIVTARVVASKVIDII
jgi:hypothetical protein